MKEISVIIPCYNVESHLDRLFQSLCKQTIGIERLEIIFVNDASTDNTLSVLKNFEKTHPQNILIVDCEENGHNGAARNIGLSYATGLFVTYIDADDYIHPYMIEYLLSAILKDDCDIAECGFSDFSGTHLDYLCVPLDQTTTIECNTEDQKKRLLMHMGHRSAPWGRLYRSEFLRFHDIYFPEGLSHCDCFFSPLCALYTTRFSTTEMPFYFYYHNDSGLTFHRQSIARRINELEVQQCLWSEAVSRRLTDEQFDPFRAELEYIAVSKILIDPYTIFKRHGVALTETPMLSLLLGLKERFPDFIHNKYIRSSKELLDVIKEILEAVRQSCN